MPIETDPGTKKILCCSLYLKIWLRLSTIHLQKLSFINPQQTQKFEQYRDKLKLFIEVVFDFQHTYLTLGGQPGPGSTYISHDDSLLEQLIYANEYLIEGIEAIHMLLPAYIALNHGERTGIPDQILFDLGGSLEEIVPYIQEFLNAIET